MIKLSRNDSCWCGSESKYKKCHYEFDEKLRYFAQKGYPIPGRELILSERDIQGVKVSGALTKTLLEELNTIIKPGISTNEIDAWVYDQTTKRGAIPAPLNYKGFPKSICTSINEVVCHGIPSERVLKEGDIINVDITCIINGYYGDSCCMYEVGQVSDKAKELITVSKQCLDSAIAALKPFDPMNIIGDEISRVAHAHDFSVVEMFGGHGIGKTFHAEPFVYHYKRREKDMICAPGMVFTIEPMINEGKKGCRILSDKWTAETVDKKLSAQWEHTVVMRESGLEILT
jgi:methionyl aminopeptidase